MRIRYIDLRVRAKKNHAQCLQHCRTDFALAEDPFSCKSQSTDLSAKGKQAAVHLAVSGEISPFACELRLQVLLTCLQQMHCKVIPPHVSLSICLSACVSVCLSSCLLVCLLACLRVCMSACLHVCLFVCLSICLPVYLSVCLSHIQAIASGGWHEDPSGASGKGGKRTISSCSTTRSPASSIRAIGASSRSKSNGAIADFWLHAGSTATQVVTGLEVISSVTPVAFVVTLMRSDFTH